jgi:hypothetical protein
VDQATVKTFEEASSDFARFAVSQGFPPNLLWVKKDDLLLGRWHGRWTYFVWRGDPAKRQNVAKIEYENSITRNIGIAFEGKCKTDRWTVCRVYVPLDDEDAQYRMIPRTGVKQSVIVDSLPAILVVNRVTVAISEMDIEDEGLSLGLVAS